MSNFNSSPAVTDCIFKDNSAIDKGGGGMNNDNSKTMVKGCVFIANYAKRAGGMDNVNSISPIVTNCIFTSNSVAFGGGGIGNNFNSGTILIGCTFRNNVANVNGGGMWNANKSKPILNNCIFTGNTAKNNGGGMFNIDNSKPTVINCTFSSNMASQSGGGIFNKNSGPIVANCILWNNRDSGGRNLFAQTSSNVGKPRINYSCIQGGGHRLGGIGNISKAPGFISERGSDNSIGTTDDNLRLRDSSPCIDAGKNAALSKDTADLDNDGDKNEQIPFDIDGNQRIVNDRVDMGAYEFQSTP